MLPPGGRWDQLFDAISTWANGAALDFVSVKDRQNYDNTSVNWRCYDGYGALMTAYAKGLPIRLETVVVRIDHSGRRIRGAGVNILHGTNYRAGLGPTYDEGREHSAATRLAGTKNIDPAPAAKAFAQYAFIPVVLDFDVKLALTSDQGLSADLGAYMPVIASKKLQVFVGPEVTFANHQYMQAYFGIDPQNRSSQSHFRNYGAGGGIKDARLGGTAMYHFDDHWFVDIDVGLERLLASAGGSPIVQTRWNLRIDSTINYTF